MKFRRLAAVAAALLLLTSSISVTGCRAPTAPDITIDINNVANNAGPGSGGGSNGAEPVTSGGTLPAGSYIRVGVFGCTCTSTSTGTCSRNAEATAPVGCQLDVTATPKAADGSDLPIAVHGPDIVWSCTGAAFECVASAASGFNRVCHARAAGVTTCTAQVKDKVGALAMTATGTP